MFIFSVLFMLTSAFAHEGSVASGPVQPAPPPEFAEYEPMTHPDARAYAVSVHIIELAKTCQRKSELPSFDYEPLIEDYLKFELEEIRLEKYRRALKKQDQEDFAKAMKDLKSGAQVNENDFQFSLLDRMLADQIEEENFCKRRADYLSIKGSSLHITFDLAEGEAAVAESVTPKLAASLTPPYMKAICADVDSHTWLEKYQDILESEKKSVFNEEFEKIKGNKEIMDDPVQRRDLLLRLSQLVHEQAGLYETCSGQAQSKISVLEQTLDGFRSKAQGRPKRVYCFNIDIGLYRTEFCEFPVDLSNTDAEWHSSNVTAKAFALKIPRGAIATKSYAPDGTYMPIIHNKEKEWDGEYETKICHNKNLGNFFDKTCPMAVDTSIPLKRWPNTPLNDDEFALSTMKTQPMSLFNKGINHISGQPIGPHPVKAVVIKVLSEKQTAHQAYELPPEPKEAPEPSEEEVEGCEKTALDP